MIGVALQIIVKKWNKSLLIPYLFLAFAATVLTRETKGTARYHLDLFWSYGEHFDYLRNQILANIAMFIPIGVLLGFEKRKRVFLYGVAFSCLIEIMQLLTSRGMFELDDIFHNIIGLVIGVALVAGIMWLGKFINERKHI